LFLCLGFFTLCWSNNKNNCKYKRFDRKYRFRFCTSNGCWREYWWRRKWSFHGWKNTWYPNQWTKNCVAGGSGGGGSSGSTSSSGGNICEKYHTCKDGTEVQYCEIIKQYDSNGNVVGAGCACKQNPEELCTSASSGGSGGGSSEPIEIPSSSGSGEGSDAETPVICSGCIVGDKCVPIGYRTGNKYCNIESELAGQKNDEISCNNAYECESNICEKNKCGKYCDGCKDENKNCIPFGTRLENNKYCNIEKSITNQKTEESTCNNSYECVSNLCVNSKCIEPSFIQKIMDWFKKLFG